jgi:hypothetical protein
MGLVIFIRFMIFEFPYLSKIGSQGMTRPEVEEFVE